MFKNIAKIFSSHIVVKTIALVNIAIILNVLNVDDFGEYSYYLVLLHLVAIVVDPFFTSYLFDYKLFNYKRYNFGIIIIPIFLLIPFSFLLYYIKDNLNIVIFILFCSYYISNAVLKSFLNAKEQYLKYGLVDVYRQVGIILSTLVVFYVLNRSDFLTLLIANYSTALVFSVFSYFFFVKKKDIQIQINESVLKKVLTKSKYLILYLALIPLISFIDSYFIDNNLTDKDLGLYSFSLKIFSISLLVVIPISTVLNIKQIELAKEDGYWHFFKTNRKRVFQISLLAFIGAVLFNWIIVTFFYTEYESSYWSTNILLCASFITYLSIPFSFLMAYRKYQTLFILALIGVFIDIVINYLFIEDYGVIAAAMATFISLTIINFGRAFLSYRFLNKKNSV